MLAPCVTLREVAPLLRMMDFKQHLLWLTNWVSVGRKCKSLVEIPVFLSYADTGTCQLGNLDLTQNSTPLNLLIEA